MKRQINAYRGHGEIAVEGHNIKLGRGGIREIEFFVQTQQLIAGGRNPELRDRDTLTTLDKLAQDGWIDADRARRHEGGLRLPAHGRAPPADGRRRADPHAAGRSRRARALRALSRLCQTATPLPRCCSGISQRAAPLRASVREGARADQAGTGVSGRCRRPQDARSAGRAGLPRAAGSIGHRAPLASRRLSLAARRVRAHASRGAGAGFCSTTSPAPTTRRDAGAFDRFLGNLHSAGAAVFAAAAESRSDRLDRARARHRAAARRHAGAPSAGDGCADRSELLRRAAGRRRTWPAARRRARAVALRRGFARPHPHVRAGAHVPDRHAHPVRHGVGASRPARPSRGSPTW